MVKEEGKRQKKGTGNREQGTGNRGEEGKRHNPPLTPPTEGMARGKRGEEGRRRPSV
jgi:hypothetical protein